MMNLKEEIKKIIYDVEVEDFEYVGADVELNNNEENEKYELQRIY